MPLFVGLVSLPLLRGTVASHGPWHTFYARGGWRVHPYQLGASVAATANGETSLQIRSYGEFAADDWVMICEKRDYGSSSLFVPNVNRIHRIASFGENEATDPTAATGATRLNFSAPVSATKGDWVLCLGADTANDPAAGPNYDGSSVQLYLDEVGDEPSPLPYLLTGSGGWFRGWTDSGREAVDLLVIDGTGSPRIVLPTWDLGPEVMG